MKRESKGNRTIIGVAWYRPNQYRRLLEVSEDKEDMHPNYINWEKGAIKANETLRAQGVAFEKVDVDIEELISWCAERKKPVNATSRSAFVADTIRTKYEGKRPARRKANQH